MMVTARGEKVILNEEALNLPHEGDRARGEKVILNEVKDLARFSI
jgi:hypothetical protein